MLMSFILIPHGHGCTLLVFIMLEWSVAITIMHILSALYWTLIPAVWTSGESIWFFFKFWYIVKDKWKMFYKSIHIHFFFFYPINCRFQILYLYIVNTILYLALVNKRCSTHTQIIIFHRDPRDNCVWPGGGVFWGHFW